MESKEAHGWGLAEAIESIRDGLLAARASGESADIRFPVESATVELHVVAAVGVDGKAGFRVPIVNLELGGSGSKQWTSTHAVTVVFGPPVDRMGVVVKVADASDIKKG